MRCRPRPRCWPAYPAGRQTELVPVAQLRAGDAILVKPGEAIAADGVIVEGETSIDASLLTGESRPLHKSRRAIACRAARSTPASRSCCG